MQVVIREPRGARRLLLGHRGLVGTFKPLINRSGVAWRLDGPELEMQPYQAPAMARFEKTAAEEQLDAALVASSKIAFQTQSSFQEPSAGPEMDTPEASDMGYPAWPDLTGLTGERDQPKYAQKAHFVRHGAEEWPSGTLKNGRQKPMTPYELKTGSVIAVTMISGINSDLPGPERPLAMLISLTVRLKSVVDVGSDVL